jgi:HlyD family secretion protein
MVWLLAPQALDVDVETVEVGEMQVTVNEDGQTRIRDTYVVSAPFLGRLMRIRLEPGDPVVQGETILAVMTAPTLDLLDPRAKAIAEARLASAAAAVQQTASAVEIAQVALEHTRVELDRAEKLFQKQNLSAALRDAAEFDVQVSEQELRRAELSQQIAKFEEEQAQAALLQANQPADGSVRPQVEIRSPIDGQVLRVWQESETNVLAGAPLLELGQQHDLEIVVDVLSSDAVQIQPGAAARLQDWGGATPLPARVRMVEPLGFTKVSALGVEEQRVNVILDLDVPPAGRSQLGAGYRVQAEIEIWRSPDAVIAPVSALFREQGKWTVFVVSQGRAYSRKVEIGRRNDLVAEVLAHLEPGEQVIVHPTDKLAEGARVTPHQKQVALQPES